MNILYNEVNDGNHSHNINPNNIKDVINKLKRGKNDCIDGLMASVILLMVHRYCFTICQSYFH